MPASDLDHQILDYIQRGHRKDTDDIARGLRVTGLRVSIPETRAALKRLKRARLVKYSDWGLHMEVAYWYPHPRYREKFLKAIRNFVIHLYHRIVSR